MMKKLTYLLPLLLLILIAYWLLSRQTAVSTTNATLIPLPSQETSAGFAQATQPNNIQFPRDLGPHPAYQTEWWYYTGNLTTPDGHEFGYQFTIFRRALTPKTAVNDSNWRTNQLYFAHFTISDITNGNFYPHERFSRGAANLAGATATPYRVWLEDWSATEIRPGVVRLLAATETVTLDIELTQTLPPILHGNAGLSQKGSTPGNASYYYSLVQQPTTGTIHIGNTPHTVTGKSWKDHEYSTSALDPTATGWDWLSLQLDNGESLMLFHIRREDGTLEPFSSGSHIAANGNVTPLQLGDWTLTATDHWRSPTTNATYPASWTLTIPTLDIQLTGAALMPNQELTVSTIYWEGAVGFQGTVRGQPVSARGYIEMTGYAGSMQGRL